GVQLGQVVAGHVLDDPAAAAGDGAVGTYHRHPDDQVTQSAGEQPAWAAHPRGQGPADRPAETDRIVGQALPGGGQARSQFGQWGPCPLLHYQAIGVVVDPHEVTQIQDQIQGSQWAAPVLGGATTPGHHGQSVFGGGLQNTAEGGGVG